MPDSQPLNRTWLAFADLLVRSREIMSPRQRITFESHLSSYFDALVVEAGNRENNRIPDIDAYCDLRRDTGPALPLLDLVEHTEQVSLPQSFRASRLFGRILDVTADLGSWINDVFSISKELDRGDCHNLVLVIRHAADVSLTNATSMANRPHQRTPALVGRSRIGTGRMVCHDEHADGGQASDPTLGTGDARFPTPQRLVHPSQPVFRHGNTAMTSDVNLTPSIPIAPGRLPLVGHMASFLRDPLGFLTSMQDVGGIVRVLLAARPIHVVTAPELVYELLTRHASTCVRGAMHDAIRANFGAGMLAI
jgi:hypothetical protein